MSVTLQIVTRISQRHKDHSGIAETLMHILDAPRSTPRSDNEFRAILNLIPINSGGGQRQAMNFLEHLSSRSPGERGQWLIFAGEGTTIHHWLEEQSSLQFRVFKSNYIRRFLIDIRRTRNAVRDFQPDVIFHFTTAWKNIEIPQVVRSVYSNIYFPEVSFWPRRPILNFWKKKLIDWFRLSGTLRADGLIFENKAMRLRAGSLFGFPLERTCYTRPARATYLERSISPNFKRSRSSFRVLYLGSWYSNKNIEKLPDVSYELKNRGIEVQFTLSLDIESQPVRSFLLPKIIKFDVLDSFEFIGTVHPLDIASCVRSVDCLILLSQLECFSGNLLEAWSFGKPLVISDQEWARSECEDAAFYVDRNNPFAIADAIEKIATDANIRNALIKNGFSRLDTLNSLEGKAAEQIAFLKTIAKAGRRTEKHRRLAIP